MAHLDAAHPTHDSTSPSLVDLRALTITYRQVRSGATIVALDGIDLRIPGGQFVAVVGPSGCGKTTL